MAWPGDRLRDIYHATVITHGENPEVFTLERGLYIPIGIDMDVLAPEIRERIMKILDGLFTAEGYPKYPRDYPLIKRNHPET